MQEPTFPLTADEKTLLGKIDFEFQISDAKPSLNAAGQLTESLLNRNAIPPVRLRFFTDPDLNIGGSRSRLETFERNGTRGAAIYSHGNFLKYLRYFLFGPDLPATVISAFGERVAETRGSISGSDYPEFNNLIRQAIRAHGLDPRDAAEEFFKLGLECGLDATTARAFRDTARKVRQ